MAKSRVSRTVFQYQLDKFIKQGQKIIKSSDINGNRVVVLDKVTMQHTRNGWMIIEPR